MHNKLGLIKDRNRPNEMGKIWGFSETFQFLILPHKMHFYEVYAQFTAIANGAREYTNIKQTYDYFFMNE